ncbi:MAG TPA: AbrB/MazE/SpoVT family DNA-binding domain-containing protein [Thermoanaerobaculia bacterium]|nr:AbrB/MazE/SpoVT family DNA-binding domain-containing protein [Thermoanaerobaculia bacterium]
MRATIDKAGRLVIPAPLRQRLGLEAGTQVELEIEGFALRLVKSVPRAEVVTRHGRLVARPRAAEGDLPAVDVARLVEEERDRWPT